MSDLVGNPEDRFSQNVAHIILLQLHRKLMEFVNPFSNAQLLAYVVEEVRESGGKSTSYGQSLLCLHLRLNLGHNTDKLLLLFYLMGISS